MPFSAHTVSLITKAHLNFLENIMKSGCGQRPGDKWLVCKYEELQRLHNYPRPIDCRNFPNNNQNQCDECESILIDCIRNCEVNDSQCSSKCNRDFVDCESNCQEF